MSEAGGPYFIRVRGRVQGPFDLEQLKRLRQRGQFSRACEFSVDGQKWQSASGLDSVFAAPVRSVRQAEPELIPEAVAEPPAGSEPTSAQAGTTRAAWYYTSGEEQRGPVSLLELRRMVSQGVVAPTDLAWKEGMPDWTAVSNVSELASVFDDKQSHFGKGFHNTTGENAVAYAGIGFRSFALMIDSFVLSIASGLLVFILIVLFSALMDVRAGSLALDLLWFSSGSVPDNTLLMIRMALCVATAILHWLYFAMMESSSQRATVGKLACGLQVLDESGDSVTFGQATARFLAKVLSNATIGIGYLMCIWTKKEQCLHDKIASCIVVKKT